jgi:hypothetical protein
MQLAKEVWEVEYDQGFLTVSYWVITNCGNLFSVLFQALTEGRGQARGEVGIAALDINYPLLILCQISDNQTYINTLTKINVLNPVEVC